jgi:hypothetical protein
MYIFIRFFTNHRADALDCVGEFVALLMIVTPPVAVPALAGVKVTLKVVLSPDASVNGGARLVILNGAPATLAWEMVTLLR